MLVHNASSGAVIHPKFMMKGYILTVSTVLHNTHSIVTVYFLMILSYMLGKQGPRLKPDACVKSRIDGYSGLEDLYDDMEDVMFLKW